MDERFSIILAECLQGLENGSLTLEDCLKRHPQYREELADLLATAAALRETARIEPRATFRRSARARLMAKLPNNQFVTFFEPIRLLIQTRPFHFNRRFVMTWIAIAVLLASLFGGGVAVQASTDALPGQALYPLKVSLEDARLALADQETQLDLYLDFADRRLAEADRLLSTGAYDQLPSLFVKYWDTAATVAGKVSYTPLVSDEVDAARADRFSQQVQTFSGLLEALPLEQQQMIWLILEEEGENPDEGEEAEEQEGEEVEEPGENEEVEELIAEPACMNHMIHPVAVKLSLQYDTPYNQLMGWFCQGFGFGEIMLALQASQSTELSAEELLLLKVELGGWGDVWKALNLIAPEEEEMVDEEQEGEEQEGEEQEGEEEAVEDPVKNESQRCPTGNEDAHPAAMKLSAEFEVEYDKIMTWFCNGFGFGEVMLALQASQKVEGYTPEELLAMKVETGGWGHVWQELGLIGKKIAPEENTDEESELNAAPNNNGKKNNPPGKQPTNKGKPANTPGGKP